MTHTIHNPVQDDHVTFVRRAADGGDTVVDVELAPGGGTPMHRHTSYAEDFTCTSGVLELVVDGTVTRLHPGASATAEIGTVHRFANPTDEPTTFRAHIRPGHPGFEQTLILSYGLAAAGGTNDDGIPRNPLHLGTLAVLSDTRLVGALAVVNPVLGLLARIARISGSERRLIERFGDT